jgi:aspartyl-tRNA(Asn)/glutamyl-tRNA(Gln) amidotransferase subunit A
MYPKLRYRAFNNSYLKALQLRQRLRSDLDAIFRSSHPQDLDDVTDAPSRGVDLYLHLTAIQTAPVLDSTSLSSQDARGYAQDLLTVPASLGGLPCISLPVGLGPDGWPVGASLTGQWGSESVLMDIAKIGVVNYNSSVE